MTHFKSRHAAEMKQFNELCLTRSRTEENTNPKAKIVGVLFVWLLAFVTQSRAQEFSAEELAHSAIERRAIEAVIWGMPAVNFDLMYQAMIRDAKAGAGRGENEMNIDSSSSSSSIALFRNFREREQKNEKE